RRLLPAAHELHHFTDQARVEKRIEHRKQKFLFIPSHGISLWLNESSSQNDGMGCERTWRTSFATFACVRSAQTGHGWGSGNALSRRETRTAAQRAARPAR